MTSSRSARRVAAVAVAVTLAAGCSGGAEDDAARTVVADGAARGCRVDLDVPAGRALFGVNLDWGTDTVVAYSERLGHVPAVVVAFAELPLTDGQQRNIDAAVEQAHASGSALMLTVEPHAGLAAVDDDALSRLAGVLAGYNDLGVPVLLRFAHEMNGSWYAWGQQPDAYVKAFRRVAQTVRARTPDTLMVWAPNYGGGYPFTGGEFAAAPGSPAHDVLDTDGDGSLTMADDPYAPYYPGDDVVDWVGMSVYHWGTEYPWGENEVPESGRFAAFLTGEHVGEDAIPDFYAEFAEKRGKPLSVTETAALFAPGAGGAAERDVKQAWWEQVLDPGLLERFPMIASVNWFEWDKHEVEVGGRVDWGVTRSDALLAGFRSALPEAFLYGGCDS